MRATVATLFGDFLIQNNLVQADDILVSLIDQLRSVPSTAEVLYDYAIIPAADLLKILAYQQNHGLDFRASAVALGLWSTEVAQQVNDELHKLRRPLGEILVEKGYLDLQQLTKALDAYVEAAYRDVPAAVLAPVADPVAAVAAVATVAVPLKNDGGGAQSLQRAPADNLSFPLVAEYCDSFANAGYPALLAAIASLEAAGDDATAVASALQRNLGEYATLRAAADFIGARQSEGVVIAVVVLLEIWRAAPSAVSHVAKIELLKAALEILSCLAQQLKTSHSEVGALNDPRMAGVLASFWRLEADLRNSKSRVAA